MTLHLFHKTASKHKAKIDRTLDAGRKLQTVFTMGDFNMLLSATDRMTRKIQKINIDKMDTIHQLGLINIDSL